MPTQQYYKLLWPFPQSLWGFSSSSLSFATVFNSTVFTSLWAKVQTFHSAATTTADAVVNARNAGLFSHFDHICYFTYIPNVHKWFPSLFAVVNWFQRKESQKNPSFQPITDIKFYFVGSDVNEVMRSVVILMVRRVDWELNSVIFTHSRAFCTHLVHLKLCDLSKRCW